MGFDLIRKIILAIIGVFSAAAAITISIKISANRRIKKSKKNVIIKQEAVGDGNIQAGGNVNINKE